MTSVRLIARVPRRARLLLLLATLGLGSVVALPVTADAGPAQDGDFHYVALGDSFTSGPLIPNPTGLLGCGQSDHNYPHLVAAQIRPDRFDDMSCGGAITLFLTLPQPTATGLNPPQFSPLDADTDLVTMGIGGNDLGFGEIVTRCGVLGAVMPIGAPCKTSYNLAGDDIQRRLDSVAGSIATALQSIHARSPHAQILVLGTGNILPDDGRGCWPKVPMASGDVPWLVGVTKRFNAMLAAQAAANGATFVDNYTSSIGHDICKPTGTKWIEGLIPTTFASPVHPNALGMRDTANQVLAAL